MNSQEFLSINSNSSDSEITHLTTSIHLHSRKRFNSSNLSSNSNIIEHDSLSPRTIVEDVEHVAKETFLLTRLALKLITFLGLGYKWITKFIFLLFYAALLMPGFLQAMYYYFFSGRVLRSIVFGDLPRNRLDIYTPVLESDDLCSVVIFVTGGAWVIGYKAWGALLGSCLSDNNIIVVCLDYRNFPQGSVSDMIHDVTRGIAWVFENISSYGGDCTKITVIGQSAGAHLAAMAVLHQSMKEREHHELNEQNKQNEENKQNNQNEQNEQNKQSNVSKSSAEDKENQEQWRQEIQKQWRQGNQEQWRQRSQEQWRQGSQEQWRQANQEQLNQGMISTLSWRPSQLKFFIGISGCYNLCDAVDHFNERGLYKSIFLNVMEGEEGLSLYSPELVIKSSSFLPSIPFLPCFKLFHGLNDYSVPFSSTVNFSSALEFMGAIVCTKLFENKTHTDLIIQDLMRGGRDEMIENIIRMIHGDEDGDGNGNGNGNGNGDKDKKFVVNFRKRMLPEFLLNAASRVSPF